MQVITLEAENFKRLKAVRICPKTGVTAIVGRNGAGKTSVLDAVEAALGGAAASPALPIRTGQTSARVVVDLEDIVVTRKWNAKGSTLEITGKDGKKQARPQDLLDGLYGTLAFDPLVFTRMKPGEQAETLARIAGVDLAAHRAKRKAAFDERTAVNRDAKTARAQLDGMPVVNAPDEEVSIGDILGQLKAAQDANTRIANARREADAMGRNAIAAKSAADAASKLPAEIERKRHDQVAGIRQQIARLQAEIESINSTAESDIKTANERAAIADAEFNNRREAFVKADAAATAMVSVDLAPLQAQAESAEATNAAVRQKKAREAKAADVAKWDAASEKMSALLERIDADFAEAIRSANLPIPGLTLSDDGVSLHGIPFDQCSGAEKLRASVAIGFALNPKLRLMLIRDGSLLDDEGMGLLDEMAGAFDAQILIERVSTGGEVGVRIEDGEVFAEPSGVTQ